MKNNRKLKNNNFSLISNNCIGGVICSDLNVPFNSPTIDLYMPAPDYIKFLENLDYYLTLEVIEKRTGSDYPIGNLGDLEIHFMHYNDFESASNKWNERKKRINFENLFIIMSDRDGCTYDIIQRFDRLAYKNKIIFTSKKYDEITSSIYCSEYKDQEYVGDMIPTRSYEKYINIVKMFNGNHKKSFFHKIFTWKI